MNGGVATQPGEAMLHSDAHIGMEFYTARAWWRCTDVGNRVVVAIRIDEQAPSSLVGPPYSVPECVFDEYDFGGCSQDPSEFELGAALFSDGRALHRDVPLAPEDRASPTFGIAKIISPSFRAVFVLK